MYFSDKILKFISFSLAILPAIFLGILIFMYGVNSPYWDQWVVGNLFIKFHSRSLSFSDLFDQQNESRLFFPRLIFISLAYLTHWDVRYEFWVIFLLACIVSANIYCLSNLTVSGSTLKKLLLATISNLLIFSPIQYENWLWGIQIVVFVPIVCLTTCILVAYSGLSARAKFLICMCLSTVSTYSYANGILCWVLALPVLTLKSRKELAKNRWLLFIWIISFVINAVAYFYNYQKPSYHPSCLEALKHPQQAIHYFLSFLGAPLAFGSDIEPLTAAPIIGLALILLFLASSFYVLKKASSSNLLLLLAGWLTIGWYTIISDIITTLGRVGFGVEQSLSSRYMTFSVYLTISLVYIITIVAERLKNKNYLGADTKKIIAQFPVFLMTIILVLHLQSSVYGVQLMSQSRSDRLQRKSCLLFMNVLPQECLAKRVFPVLPILKETAPALDKLGYLHPALLKTNKIQDIKVESNLSSHYGYFDKLTKANKDVYVASGWAVLPEREETADLVVLTYKKVEGEPIIFAIVDTFNIVRQDVAKAFKKQSYSNSGWEKSFDSSQMPSGSLKVEAWAFNSDSGKAFHLNSTHVIQN
ncbi:MAG TPA: hypothetical protein DEV81_24765 [Cyanobacteria bacterium UBA11049]|nr:hypothetical protein [Cyanobacteria bacterium UBA11049]